MNIYDDPNIQAKVVKLKNQGYKHREIAERIGIAKSTVDKCLKHHQESNPVPIDEFEVVLSDKKGELDLFILSPRIKTPEDALRKAEMDPEEWEIVKCIVKSWELGAKVEGTNHHGHKFTRGIAVEPLYGLTIHCKRRKGYSPNIFLDRFREALRGSQSYINKSGCKSTGETYEGLISIPDIHFGKLAWSETSDQDYSLSYARDIYLTAVDHLVHEMSVWQPRRINYIIGNDALHIDNNRSQTTKGTYVDSDCKWQDAYIQLCKTLRDSIDLLKQYAPVNVVVIPGNHDEEKMFTVGFALNWLYENDNYVSINSSPKLSKYIQIGNTLIRAEHGHNFAREKKSIGHLMAAEEPELWAKSQFREVITGHWHRSKDDSIEFTKRDTVKGLVIRTLPSLAVADEWHYKQGYISLQAAEAHIYHLENGHCASLEYRV